MKKRAQQSKETSQFYPVEAIRGKRYNSKTHSDQYLIKWKGWAEKYNTWEPTQNIIGCDLVIGEFEAQKIISQNFIRNEKVQPKHTMLEEQPAEKQDQSASKDSVEAGMQYFIESVRQQIQLRENNEAVDFKQIQTILDEESKVADTDKMHEQNENIKTGQQQVGGTKKKGAKRGRKPKQDKSTKPLRKRIRKDPTIAIKKNMKQKQVRVQRLNSRMDLKSKTQTTQLTRQLQRQQEIEKMRFVLVQEQKKRVKEMEIRERKKKIGYSDVRSGNVVVQQVDFANSLFRYTVRDRKRLNIPLSMSTRQLIEVNRGVLLQFYKSALVNSAKIR